jgi:hypothetical protein
MRSIPMLTVADRLPCGVIFAPVLSLSTDSLRAGRMPAAAESLPLLAARNQTNKKRASLSVTRPRLKAGASAPASRAEILLGTGETHATRTRASSCRPAFGFAWGGSTAKFWPEIMRRMNVSVDAGKLGTGSPANTLFALALTPGPAPETARPNSLVNETRGFFGKSASGRQAGNTREIAKTEDSAGSFHGLARTDR